MYISFGKYVAVYLTNVLYLIIDNNCLMTNIFSIILLLLNNI